MNFTYNGYDVEVTSFWQGTEERWKYKVVKNKTTFGGCCFSSATDATNMAKEIIDDKEKE